MDHPVFALLADPTKSARVAFMSDILGSIIRLVGIEGATPHGLRKFWEQSMHVEKIAYQNQILRPKKTVLFRNQHTYMPFFLWSTYFPVNGRSVPFSLSTWNSSGVRIFLHSSSDFLIFRFPSIDSLPNYRVSQHWEQFTVFWLLYFMTVVLYKNLSARIGWISNWKAPTVSSN